jgi:sugar lactone lactonase YvrE
MRILFSILAFLHALSLQAAGPLTIETKLSSVLPDLLATDSTGNIYIGETTVRRVRKLAPGGILSPYVGAGGTSFLNESPTLKGVDLPSLSSVFQPITSMAADSSGNVFLFDSMNSRMFRATPAGLVSTISGTGGPGGSPDGTPAISASLVIAPQTLAVSPGGVIYFYDSFYNKVRSLTVGGVLASVAGNGGTSFNSPPDGVDALSVALPSVKQLTVDASGNLFVYSDYGSGYLFKIANGLISLVPGGQNIGVATALAVHPTRGLCFSNSKAISCIANGVQSLVAGSSSQSGYFGDGGAATGALFNDIRSLATDPSANLIVGDYGNARVRRITPGNIVESLASGTPDLGNPSGVAVDAAGNLYFADWPSNVVRRAPPNGASARIAGVGVRGNSINLGSAIDTPLTSPTGVAVDADGAVFVADSGNNRLLKVASNGSIADFWTSDWANSVTVGLNRSTYFTDASTLRLAAPSGATQIVAGDPFSRVDFGDGGPALAAGLMSAYGSVTDAAGNIYVATQHQVRRVTPGGAIVNVAGDGICGDTGDGGLAANARLCSPRGLAIDVAGNLYIADSGNRKIRRVDPNGLISTFAGTGEAGYYGDGAEATMATLNSPWGLAFDSAGALLIADHGAAAIRRIAPGSLCTLTSNAWVREASGAGVSGVIAVNAAPSSCSITATSNASWLRIGSGGSGTGAINLSYVVDANSQFTPRTAHITISAQGSSISFRVYQNGSGCPAISFSPSLRTLTSDVGYGYAMVPGGMCTGATPSVSDSWVKVDGWQLGGGTLYFNYPNNPLPVARTATVRFAGSNLTLIQDAAPLSIVSPSPGSTLRARSITFVWTAIGSTSYRYKFGTTPGGSELALAQTRQNSVTLDNIPLTGPVYAAIWYANSFGGWSQMPVTAVFTADVPAEVRAVSVSPASGGGRQQTFSFTYTDTRGTPDLSVAWIWIGPNLTPGDGSAACILYYEPGTRKLFLLGEGASGPWIGPLTPGVAGTVANNRCAIDGAASSEVQSGVTLTLNVAVTFKSAFNGPKNIYSYAAAFSGSDSGWQTKGSWTVADPTPVVSANSVTPRAGSGAAQTFALKYFDSLGAADFASVWAWFGPFTPGDGSKSCILFFVPESRSLYLLDSAGSGWSAPASLGAAGSLSNVRCSVNLAASSVSTSGAELTLNLAMVFVPGQWSGVPINMYAAGSTADSGWMELGQWTVPPAPLSVVSAAASAPTGAQQTLSITIQDMYGAADISEAQFWIEGAAAPTDASKACIVRYDKNNNAVSLRNDANTAWVQAYTAADVLRNRRCNVNVATSSVSSDSTTLTWRIDIAFTSEFIGVANIHAYGVGAHGATGWQNKGSFTVPASAPPPSTVSIDYIAPSFGSGLETTFTTGYTDAGGASAISETWWWIADSFTPGNGTNACIIRYHQASGSFYLLNDAGTEWSNAVAPGAAVTVSNSRCSLLGANSKLRVVNATLALDVALTFAPSFGGDKQVFGYVAGTGVDGWKKLGVWTVPAPAAPRLTVSQASPATGSGTSQTFQFSFVNSQGASQTSEAWVWIGPSFTPGDGSKSCILRFDNQLVYLLNDAGTGWSTGGAPGAGFTLTNSRCSVSLAGVSVTRNGQTLSLVLPMSFALAGQQVVYAYAAGMGINSGWQNVGAWTVPPTPAPLVTIAGPVSGSGTRASISVTASSLRGPADVGEVWVWVAASFTPGNGTSACIFRYSRPENLIYILNDAGDAWLASGRPGAPESIENSRCRLHLALSSVSVSTNVVLTLGVVYKAGFAGEKVVYGYAAGQASASGWKPVGAYTVSTDVNTPVRFEWFSSKPFALNVYDEAGVDDLREVWMWIADEFTPGDGSNACIFRLDAGGVSLLSADGANWLGPESTQSLSNGRCGASATASRYTNELIWEPFAQYGGFSGVKKVFAYASGSAGSTGWQQVGTLTAP